MARGWVSALAQGLVKAPLLVYRYTISPFTPAACRHLPSCSAYADEAIARFGPWYGAWVASARILRCNPLGSHGLDPVPEKLSPGVRWFCPWRAGRWTGGHIKEKFYTDG
ncbi:MAG: membrane protein insertion efficiency factor YidD [Alphaproteobacteria bacterium]